MVRRSKGWTIESVSNALDLAVKRGDIGSWKLLLATRQPWFEVNALYGPYTLTLDEARAMVAGIMLGRMAVES